MLSFTNIIEDLTKINVSVAIQILFIDFSNEGILQHSERTVMKHILLLVFLFCSHLAAQIPQNSTEPDKCGFPDTTTAEYRLAASGNWGYGYDTLLYDLEQWKKSMYVTVDSCTNASG